MAPTTGAMSEGGQKGDPQFRISKVLQQVLSRLGKLGTKFHPVGEYLAFRMLYAKQLVDAAGSVYDEII